MTSSVRPSSSWYRISLMTDVWISPLLSRSRIRNASFFIEDVTQHSQRRPQFSHGQKTRVVLVLIKRVRHVFNLLFGENEGWILFLLRSSTFGTRLRWRSFRRH